NAAAMALSEGIAVQVAGPEHYVAALHLFTDTAAPIHAPHGEVLAVLGIAALEREGTPHTLAIVMAAAKAIENQLQADLTLSEALQHLAELDVTLQAVRKGILFLDTEGKVTHMNARAGEILCIQQRTALGRQIRSLLTLPAEVDAAMQRCVAIQDREVAFMCGGLSQPCVVTMTPLGPEADVAGFVLTLEPTAEVRHLVHRMVGASAHFAFEDIIGRDLEMRHVLQYARQAAQCEANVLLLGESGTGKDVFAQAIHRASPRASGPFVSLDCTAVPRELLAVGLFGYEGTLLGVEEVGRPGKFELAAGGTVFLDNVDGLPLPLQANLLHILDTGEVTRLGSIRSTPVDVRVIAASSSPDILGEVQRGRFRADLFYRLNVLTLTIPPLRARGNDIVLLINHLLDKSCQRLGKKVTIAPEAMAMLQSYHWPGNVRELQNVLERALYVMTGDMLLVQHLPAELCAANIGRPAERIISIQEAERQAIIRAGRALQGNMTAMARVLGIGRTTLWRKMKALRIPADSFAG
ncbi:MAG: sigma-54-dependent Fis family transcriptional regulator, partial [Chloroflexi bacterium]|nr:sigma-54-dependent Fis family transcriptional regulator [Chloroflexota bacterium]